MDMDFGANRVAGLVLSAVSLATAGAGAAAMEAQKTFFGIMPQSFLFGALAGALIGVVILPNKEAGITIPDPAWPAWRKATLFAVRALALGAAVLAYALLAGATINTLVVFFHGIEAAGVSISLILGAFIRPLLPKYLAGVEGITDRVLGNVGPK